MPVDAILNKARDLPYEAVDLERVMETLDGAQVRMVVLDACRNNPFARTWKSGTRAVRRGLAGIEVDDVIVIYAAAPGQTASDGDGAANSPFATALARRLPEIDLPLQLLGGSVRDDVLAATNGDQRPFVSASVTGTPIYLRPELRTRPALGEAGAAPSGPAVLTSGAVLVSDIRIETIKLSGFFGRPDNLFIEFPDGQRIPGEPKSSYRVKKGDIWEPGDTVTLPAGSSFRVMEYDDVGGHDLLGTVQLAPVEGSHSVTLNGDKSEYRLTYSIAPTP
ncbi:MAG: caspase family protein [Pseudomonadota bacterium]